MVEILGVLLLLLLFAAPPATQALGRDLGIRVPRQDKKDRGKTPELTRKYVECMESNRKEMKSLKEDIEKDKPEADLKAHLSKIRENIGKARSLKYRKNEDEADQLEGHFDIFEVKLKQDFEEVPWGDKEKRLILHERLQAKCDVCHETLRD